MHSKFSFSKSSTRNLAPLSISISILFFSTATFFIPTAHAQAEIPPRPLPPGHRGTYFPPPDDPKHPTYFPTEHKAPFFAASELDATAPLLRTLAHYDAFEAHFGGHTRIERVGGMDRLIRVLPADDHHPLSAPRHVATFGMPPPDTSGRWANASDADRPALVGESHVVNQILDRAHLAEKPHINVWDHPWEGQRCYSVQCEIGWECKRKKCSSVCIYHRCV